MARPDAASPASALCLEAARAPTLRVQPSLESVSSLPSLPSLPSVRTGGTTADGRAEYKAMALADLKRKLDADPGVTRYCGSTQCSKAGMRRCSGSSKAAACSYIRCSTAKNLDKILVKKLETLKIVKS